MTQLRCMASNVYLHFLKSSIGRCQSQVYYLKILGVKLHIYVHTFLVIPPPPYRISFVKQVFLVGAYAFTTYQVLEPC
jgi:hypothetical protein